MSTLSNGGARRPPFTEFRIDGFDACWAARNPLNSGFCLGSADGHLLFTDEEGNVLSRFQHPASMSGEAINGVASYGQWLAITTRNEVTLLTLPPTGASGPPPVAFPVGAHGVIAMESGFFIAPLGQSGLMVVKPQLAGKPTSTVSSATEGNPYFYSAIGLRTPLGREVLVCATRRDGVATMEFAGESGTHSLNTINSEGLDVVDVCALDGGAGSLAAAALGADGTLVMFRDVTTDKKPVTLKFSTVEGKAYQLLSGAGDMYLLTSKGLYVLGKLATRFLEGESIERLTTPVLALPMEAVDANLYNDDWLLVVMPEEVRKYDLGLMRKGTSEYISHGQIRELQPMTISPTWRQKELTQHSGPMLAAVA